MPAITDYGRKIVKGKLQPILITRAAKPTFAVIDSCKSKRNVFGFVLVLRLMSHVPYDVVVLGQEGVEGFCHKLHQMMIKMIIHYLSSSVWILMQIIQLLI